MSPSRLCLFIGRFGHSAHIVLVCWFWDNRLWIRPIQNSQLPMSFHKILKVKGPIHVVNHFGITSSLSIGIISFQYKLQKLECNQQSAHSRQDIKLNKYRNAGRPVFLGLFWYNSTKQSIIPLNRDQTENPTPRLYSEHIYAANHRVLSRSNGWLMKSIENRNLFFETVDWETEMETNLILLEKSRKNAANIR